MDFVESGHRAWDHRSAACSIKVGLLRASCGLLRPRLGVDGERGRFTPGSPMIERQRDMDHIGEFRQQAQRQVKILCAVHVTAEATVPTNEVGAEHREVAQVHLGEQQLR